MKPSKIKKVLRRLDGVVFTGGSQPYYRSMHVDDINQFLENIQLIEKGHRLHPDNIIEREKTTYFSRLSFIMKEARAINDSGRVFPIWAVCLGFEGMLLNDGETHIRLNQFHDRNKTHGIKTQPNDADKLNGSFAKFIKDHFANREQERFFFYYHIRGFTPTNFYSDPYLKNKYNILAVSDQNDFLPGRVLTEQTEYFNKHFYKDLKHHKIVIDSEKRDQRNRELELVVNRMAHYKSPFAVRKLLDDSSLKHVKTDFRSKSSLFVAIVENKKYPFYGLQFHPEKSLYDFHNNKHVQVSDENRWNNEMLLVFFLEKIISGKIKYLKKLLNLQNDLKGYKKLLRKRRHKRKEEKQLYLFSKLRDYIFQSCKVQPRSKGCRKFDYSLLESLNSNYQKSLSKQIILDFDQFYNKKFNKKVSYKQQDKISMSRLLVRNISVFDEILLIR